MNTQSFLLSHGNCFPVRVKKNVTFFFNHWILFHTSAGGSSVRLEFDKMNENTFWCSCRVCLCVIKVTGICKKICITELQKRSRTRDAVLCFPPYFPQPKMIGYLAAKQKKMMYMHEEQLFPEFTWWFPFTVISIFSFQASSSLLSPFSSWPEMDFSWRCNCRQWSNPQN